MKKQTRLASALGLALTLTVLCAGCGSSDTPSGGDQSITPPDSLAMVRDYDIQTDADAFVGIWLPAGSSEYSDLEIGKDGSDYYWILSYDQETIAASGYLQYEELYDCIYAHNDYDDEGHPIALNADGSLTLTSFGTFVPGQITPDNSGDGSWIYFDGSDSTGGGQSASYDTSESGWSAAEADPAAFAGVWYRHGDLDADSFIVIDEDGSWHLYQRAPGAENAEMDYGSIIPSEDEPFTYYAVSDPYGLSYRMFDYDTDEITWGDENDYYDRLE